MKTNFALALVLLGAQVAAAEASWLTARGRLLSDTRVEVMGGPRSVGVGIVKPDTEGARAGMSGEAQWALFDRVLELRGARVWQLTATRFATVSAAAGGTVFLVPEGKTDVGVGPHGSLTLSLGGEHFTFDLGVQSGIEVFAQTGARLPERVLAGLNFRFGDFTISAMGRAGVDLVPGGFVAIRAEAMFTVGWLGLERELKKLPPG